MDGGGAHMAPKGTTFFNNHKNLVEVALVTAEDLHGRYLAALRNNEYDVAKSIVSAINLNKSTEIKAFENSLEDFNNKSLNAYNNFEDLPYNSATSFSKSDASENSL